MSRTIAKRALRAAACRAGCGGIGIGTVIIIGLISWYFGIDPSVLLNGAQILTGGESTSQQSGTAPPVTTSTPSDPMGKFVALVLGDTEDRWKEIFAAGGRTYHPPRLRLLRARSRAAAAWRARPWARSTARTISASISTFRSSTTCRTNSAAARQQCLQVFRSLCDRPRGRPSRAERARHSAARDADAAGIRKQGRSKSLQVRVELQADCFAGVWANRAQQKHSFLDPGDVDQARQTASAIGDDRLQKKRKAMSCPMPSPTELRNSANTGSCQVSNRAKSGPATPWRPTRFSVVFPPRIRRPSAWSRGPRSGGAVVWSCKVCPCQGRRQQAIRTAQNRGTDGVRHAQLKDDKSGALLVQRIGAAGHLVAERSIVYDDSRPFAHG